MFVVRMYLFLLNPNEWRKWEHLFKTEIETNEKTLHATGHKLLIKRVYKSELRPSAELYMEDNLTYTGWAKLKSPIEDHVLYSVCYCTVSATLSQLLFNPFNPLIRNRFDQSSSV